VAKKWRKVANNDKASDVTDFVDCEKLCKMRQNTELSERWQCGLRFFAVDSPLKKRIAARSYRSADLLWGTRLA
jgi:hypothetical protein